MARKKNLERAIILGLILSTGVYGSAWAEGPITDDNWQGYENKLYNSEALIENNSETEAAIKLENADNVTIGITTNGKNDITLDSEGSGIRVQKNSNGGSITAVKDGKCVDTSMGFTPLAGIMMGTRSGDIDPSIIPYVMEQEGKNASEVIDDLNKKSGLFGISEYSSDMRDILERCDLQDEKAVIARDKYVRRVVDYIAQYYVLLGGADVIAFTAGVGENSIPVRRQICEELACLGVKIDLDQNNKRGEVVKISTDDSSIAVYVIPTDEELMIARDTLDLINR